MARELYLLQRVLVFLDPPLARQFGLPSRTDLLVSVNLTVPILDERWSPILVTANLRAVSYRGHVALRQTEIGQYRK